VLRVERDQMIGALAPDRPDQAFNISALPGRAKRGEPDEIFGRRAPRECFVDLARQTLRRWVLGHHKPQQLPPSMAKNKKYEQPPKGTRRNDNEINRCNLLQVIAKEILPSQRNFAAISQPKRAVLVSCPRHASFRPCGLTRRRLDSCRSRGQSPRILRRWRSL
jgi:hypothetical protein